MEALGLGFFDFMEKGGEVLWGILAATVLLWWLVLERLWFFRFELPTVRQQRLNIWQSRPERASWHAALQRIQLISEVDCAMASHLKTITAFIALLPMLGLLGTVTGMIQVFDVMASLGSGNPRAMADGVSAATIPTLAGMVVSISAIPFATHLHRRHKGELRLLGERMRRA